MKKYAILSFGPRHNQVIKKLERIGFLKILGATAFKLPLTDQPFLTRVNVETVYVVAKVLSFLFARGIIADDICKINIDRMEKYAENDDGIRHLMAVAQSINGVFRG